MNNSEQKCAITMFDDIQRHDKTCDCGDCDKLTGRSFGVSIRECEGCGCRAISDELVEKALVGDAVIDRIYAPSTKEARERARLRAEELGYTFLGDI